MEQNLKVNENEYLPLRDVVFNTLRQAILRGEFKPGERLMEIQLANKLGVSRTPIREAIRKLELEGLVIMIPRKGAEVADITEKSLRDVLEVRKALEELAVQLACEKITQEELEELEQAGENFKKVLNRSKDITEVAEADVRFHDVIYMATDNQKLIHVPLPCRIFEEPRCARAIDPGTRRDRVPYQEKRKSRSNSSYMSAY